MAEELKTCPFCHREAQQTLCSGLVSCAYEDCPAFLLAVFPESWNARAKQPSQGGEAAGWRAHSLKYAKGEKCPDTIETLQAAWDRDQELINDLRHEIARHKTRINRLEQRRPVERMPPDSRVVPVELLKSWVAGLQCGIISQRRVLEDIRELLEVKP